MRKYSIVANTVSTPVSPRHAQARPLATAATTTTHSPQVLADRRTKVARRSPGSGAAGSIGARIQDARPTADNENCTRNFPPAPVFHPMNPPAPPGQQDTKRNHKTMKRTLTTIAGALALVLTGGAYAQGPGANGPGGPRGPGHRLPPQVREKLVAEFDKDGDGQLNDEERQAARAAFQAKMAERHKEALDQYDTDRDGKLSDDERKALIADRKKEFMAKHDKDGDGQLSDEERKAVREEFGDRPGMRFRHGFRGRRGPGGPGGPPDAPAEPGNQG
jgi:Ca2+-binding EF-hand superfamily protein